MMKEKKEIKKAKTTGKTKKWYEKLSKLSEKQLKISNSIDEFKENFLMSFTGLWRVTREFGAARFATRRFK